ncbi:predicted esterase [Chthonomonas calidirosea]|uniref:alpha/beta hydrolase n=1 Tax=Chthonomonas calidirosea TaxID=454171 RepID=UPI0006DD4A06|nr:alpha/beta hydrolase family protein [Chthonomonas calidirosea]CEK14418.1 predicted esterase [Chthonomonas calidirosea]
MSVGRVEERTYYSQALKRTQPFSVYLPELNGNEQLPLLILLHGRGGSHRDWFEQTRALRYLAGYYLCVVCPQGDDGWYTDAFDGSGAYETDLIACLIPHLQATLPIAPPGKAWAIEGLSMGGYGAIKLALRHYKLFGTAVSHSGAFDITQSTQPHPVFGDLQTCRRFRRQHNVYALAEEALCRYPYERAALWIDCGLQDELLASTRRFHNHLHFIGYGHEYKEGPGYHTWPYWDRAFRAALPWVAQRVGAKSVSGRVK